MSEQIDFTIVTPSFGYGHYIGACLESVASQKGVTFEHLVMDAGSKDDTADVVSRFPHAQFFQEPDRGMSDGINKGFRKAKGKWVMWLNADDQLKQGALEAVKKHAEEQENVDVIYGGWDFVDAEGDFVRRVTLFPFDLKMLIYGWCYIGSTSCFYRRDSVIDEGHFLDEDFGYCMDGEYYARLGTLGKKFSYFPAILAEFRLHDQSISQRNQQKRDLDGLLKMHRQWAEPRTIRRFYGKPMFQSEHGNQVADSFLYLYYSGIKRLKRWQNAGSVRVLDEKDS